MIKFIRVAFIRKASTMNRYWWCPACDHGYDSNHRKCLTQHFRFNGADWETACFKAGAERARKHLIEFSEDSEFWLKKTNSYAVLPAGAYFIGDVYSALPSSLTPRLREGAYSRGEQIYVAGKTLYNRSFTGSNGSVYDITSGYIGIMTVNLCNNLSSGTYHTFTTPVEVTLEDHVLRVRSDMFFLTIDTRMYDTLG
jgi:hypothetical protein